MAKVHHLKCWPEPFQATLDGRKPCEWRKDDRGFEVGDTVHLREWNPDTGQYTGRELWADVTDIQRGPAWGIPEGYVMMSIPLLRMPAIPTPCPDCAVARAEAEGWKREAQRVGQHVREIHAALEEMGGPRGNILTARQQLDALREQVERLVEVMRIEAVSLETAALHGERTNLPACTPNWLRWKAEILRRESATLSPTPTPPADVSIPDRRPI